MHVVFRKLPHYVRKVPIENAHPLVRRIAQNAKFVSTRFPVRFAEISFVDFFKRSGQEFREEMKNG